MSNVEIAVRLARELIYQGPATLSCAQRAGAHHWELKILTDLERAVALGQARAAQAEGTWPVVAVGGAGTGRVSIAEGPIGSALAIRLVGQSGCPLPAHR